MYKPLSAKVTIFRDTQTNTMSDYALAPRDAPP